MKYVLILFIIAMSGCTYTITQQAGAGRGAAAQSVGVTNEEVSAGQTFGAGQSPGDGKETVPQYPPSQHHYYYHAPTPDYSSDYPQQQQSSTVYSSGSFWRGLFEGVVQINVGPGYGYNYGYGLGYVYPYHSHYYRRSYYQRNYSHHH